ncbi:MAG: Stk1 family PASTA domain-containing Ser/Thr kinase [Candidatus Eremiobacteraeota bacterium]|nr:Stk1 family PASTA domain-containing Ser/Thr kinase [Candidatus Eremiobacteraeota bacterium]
MTEQLFNNRYRLETPLGEGGMATVYSGTDTLLRRQVAIKVLRPQYAADADFVRRFYQEAESAAKLSHPNIVNTYDVGHEGDSYYIVMELVDGPSLGQIISADGTLPEPVAIDFAAQICSGLAYAHRQGILHRDIKPANILVTKDDVVKLSDFGIARAVSQHTMALTKPGMVMGSVYYISPEQAQGHQLKETSDLYSVGIVLYQMLTGKLPYSGDSPVTVALKHISQPVPAIDASALGVSPALAAIVNKLLQKNPEHRFASASEVASALREARERPAVPAYATGSDAPTTVIPVIPPLRPPPRPSPFPDRPLPYMSVTHEEVRRSGLPTGLLLGLAALLIVGALIGYFSFNRSGSTIVSRQVLLANYVGKSDVTAKKALAAAGLRPHVALQSSETVAAGHIIRQQPAPGAKLAKNAVVELVVSSGLPIGKVPDVAGFSLADAQRDIERSKLKVHTHERFDPAAKGIVIAQQPAANANVREGSVVTLTVSSGPKPITVPALVSLTLDKAGALLKRSGLTLTVTDKTPSDNIPAGTIVSQDTPQGTTLGPGGSVGVVVSSGPEGSTVPNVGTRSLKDAVAAITDAGFKPEITYSVQPGDANGSVIAQAPDPRSNLRRGSAVKIWVSVSGVIPDVANMTLDDAKAALQAAGYELGNVAIAQEGPVGKVVRTDPPANSEKRPGEAVTIYCNCPGAGAVQP